MEKSKDEQELRRVWYAVQTFHRMEECLGNYLADNNIAYFIPKCSEEQTTQDARGCRESALTVHNILFVEMTTLDPDSLRKLMAASPVPFFIMCYKETGRPCEMNDPEITRYFRCDDSCSQMIQ